MTGDDLDLKALGEDFQKLKPLPMGTPHEQLMEMLRAGKRLQDATPTLIAMAFELRELKRANAHVRRQTYIEAIDALEVIHADTLTGNSAEVRATLVEVLRDLGRVAPSWDPKKYDNIP